jgi:hypothetical protein
MPTQSIDLASAVVATFNGSAVEQINLNGAGIWTQPPQNPTGQARIFGPTNGVRPFGAYFTGPTNTYAHFDYVGDMSAIAGDGIVTSGILKTSTAQMRYGESIAYATAHLQPTSQGYQLPATLAVPAYNYNGNTGFWTQIATTTLYTRLGPDNTVEVWLAKNVGVAPAVRLELTTADLTYETGANLFSYSTGMSANFDGTGAVTKGSAPTHMRSAYMGNSEPIATGGNTTENTGIKLGYFDATKTFIVDEKITATHKTHSIVWGSTDQYGNVLIYAQRYEIWRNTDNSLYYVSDQWLGDPRPYNWNPLGYPNAVFKCLRKLEGPINGNLSPYEEGTFAPTTTPYSNQTHAYHKTTYRWVNGQLTAQLHWSSVQKKVIKLP